MAAHRLDLEHSQDLSLVEGYDLHIDNSVLELGKASNAISSGARGLFYVLILCCLLSFTAFLNTRFGNPWTRYRIEKLKSEIQEDKKELLDAHSRAFRHIPAQDPFHRYQDSLFQALCGPGVTSNRDSCKHRYDSLIAQRAAAYRGMNTLATVADTDSHKAEILHKEEKLKALQRNSIENVQTLRMPIVGISFDVDDLGIISGLVFITLYFLLHSLLKRKVYNLHIVLIAATHRYSDDADANKFRRLNPLTKQKDLPDAARLAAINRARRKYHYNHLSFHEGYLTIQYEFMDREDRFANRKKSFWNWVSKTIIRLVFYAPAIIMLFVVTNDYYTFKLAAQLNRTSAIVSIVLSTLLFIFIISLAHKNTRQLVLLEKIYRKFRDAGYRYLPPELRVQESSQARSARPVDADHPIQEKRTDQENLTSG